MPRTPGGVNYEVVIPSRQRVGTIAGSLRMFPGAIVTVEDSEVADYAPIIAADKLLPHPPSPFGLGWIKHWVMERTPDKHAVIFADDDLTHVSCLVGRHARRITDPDAIRQLVENQIDIAADLDVCVFGWTRHPNPAFFSSAKPFSLTGHVDVMFGVRKGRPGVTFHPELFISSEAHLALSALLHDRFLVIDSRFYFAGASPNVGGRTANTAPGGFEGVRTHERQAEDVRKLKRIWGEYIDCTPSAKSKNPFGERFKVKRQQ